MNNARISVERKYEEAFRRLNMLKLHPDVAEQFKQHRVVYYSERTRLGGILYWITNEPGILEKIREFEKEHSALVYHVTHEYTSFGECWDFLYVSDFEDDWEYDRNDLKEGMPYAYVFNATAPFCSETGTIRIKEAAGGLIRVA